MAYCIDVNIYEYKIRYFSLLLKSLTFAVLTILFFNTGTAFAVSAESSNIIWQHSQPTIAVGALTAESMDWSGSPEIIVVKMRPGRWRFESNFYQLLPEKQRLSAREWLQQTQAVVTINAGQYDTELNHLGWFIHKSRNLGSRQHPIWKGIFASTPNSPDGTPVINILDLKTTPLKLKSFKYTEAVQSLMLFDSKGTIRVNRSDRRARRCVVALDDSDNLYIFVTRGECTLWNLADYLKSSPLNLNRAISLDGGAQAQISIRLKDTEIHIPGFQVAIPCAICFSPIVDAVEPTVSTTPSTNQ